MTETMTKAQIVAEIDRIGHDVLEFGQHAIFARLSVPKADLLIVLANFRLMEELKRRQQVIASRYDPYFWNRAKYAVLRSGLPLEGWAKDAEQWQRLDHEISRIFRARWTVLQEIDPRTPNPEKE